MFYDFIIFYVSKYYASGNDRLPLRAEACSHFQYNANIVYFFVSKNNWVCNFNIKNMLYYLLHRTVIYVPTILFSR